MRYAILLATLCCAAPASAYTLITSVSSSCHERLTFEAINRYIVQFGLSPNVVVPNDRISRKLTALVRQSLPPDVDDAQAFLALSVIVGVRAPDTEGHSTLNLSALRRLHADPAPAGQYAHALRGPDDDGLEGDLIAIEGTKQVIRDQLALARSYMTELDGGMLDVVERRAFFVDHYETLDVPVSLVGYHIGRAIHALQDAHAHMVRAGDSYDRIVHVTNYVDAVNGDLEADRDGLAHSDALDDCTREDVQPIANVARDRSIAMARAFVVSFQGDPDAIERGLSPCADEATDRLQCGWLEYDPDCKAAIESGDTARQAEVCCTRANDFCRDTVPAAAIVRLEPAGPYLDCSAAPSSESSGLWWLVLPALFGLRRRGLVLALVALPFVARAETPAPTPTPDSAIVDYVPPEPDWFISLEGHGAGINDTPNAAFLDVEFGYTLRFGRRIDRWRVTGIVDRSFWVPLEFGARVDAGVLNVGVGAEVLLFDDFVRIGFGVGTSVLLFDTAFDERGTVGYFTEGRPAGLRWKPTDSLVIVFDPVSMSFLHPVVRNPPLRKLHRRTSVGLEYLL